MGTEPDIILDRGYPREERFESPDHYRTGKNALGEESGTVGYLYACTLRPFGGVSPLYRAEIGEEWDLRGAKADSHIIGTETPLTYHQIRRCDLVELDPRTRAGTVLASSEEPANLQVGVIDEESDTERVAIHIEGRRGTNKEVVWTRTETHVTAEETTTEIHDTASVGCLLSWIEEMAQPKWEALGAEYVGNAIELWEDDLQTDPTRVS